MDSEILIHTGVAHDANPPGRGSGRYEFGTGLNPEQHQKRNFLSVVNKLKRDGLSESEIARGLLGIKSYKKDGTPIYYTSTDLKAEISIATTAVKIAMQKRARDLYFGDCHENASEVGRRLGINESSVRSLLNSEIAERTMKYNNTADELRKLIEEKGIIDVSSGQELYLNVSDHTKKVAIAMLEREGYVKTYVQLPQLTNPGKKTSVVVLGPKPEEGQTEQDVRRYIQENKYNIATIADFSPDKGQAFWTPEFPASLDSQRVKVRYAEEGGKDKDGVIELRRGVQDISLGPSQYAQVRIMVDGTNYLKGMAMYGDDADFPDGVDVIFNTNKHVGTPLIDTNATFSYDPKTDTVTWSGNEVSKRLKVDKEGNVNQDNPFGAAIKSPKDRDGIITAGGQSHYIDEDGVERLSVINKLQDEGDWDSWSRTLASQFLSKQPPKLIKQQIDLSLADKEEELEQINNLTNPVIKKKLLNDFADGCDANASDLSVRGFKNQAFQVILPQPNLSETEIYAPNFDDGDQVALVRYPHGGIFEIPVLTVNNKAKNVTLDNPRDAVGINPRVAEQLSGADFDGDTALIIPVKSNRINVLHEKYLDDLKGFDPKESYKLPDSAPSVKNDTKQLQMGIATNLITDMTVGGAKMDEIARAVKHSMVVIDSEKHHLDYKKSAEDFGIEELRRTYQGENPNGTPRGASTIFSQASSTAYVPRRKEVTDVKKMTPEEVERWNQGYKIYHQTGETSVKLIKDTKKMTEEEKAKYDAGQKVFRDTGKLKTIKISKMDKVDDAMELVRDPNNPKEVLYANYANSLKSMAREARVSARSIEPTPISREAAKTYASEVESLKAKLRVAEMNRPLERKAQALGNAMLAEKMASNPGMDYEHQSREAALCLTKARAAIGAKKEPVKITDKEWEAIQANALSTSTLERILKNTDQDAFRKRATPRATKGLTEVQIKKALAMSSSGMYTTKEIADSLGVSPSTVSSLIAKERS